MTPIEELSILRQLGDLLWQAIAALSTEAIDVERLRELIISQAARAVAMRRIGMNGKEEDEIANCLRQLLRIAEGKP